MTATGPSISSWTRASFDAMARRIISCPAMTPRPPEGDWLGTPYLRFERHGSLAHCVVDRPEKRNAMTPAMYFGVRHAVDVVNRDPALSGLLLTGSGDVFIAGGDMSMNYDDNWA